MSKTHTWFATKNDLQLILKWLKDAGAVFSDDLLDRDLIHQLNGEFVIQFPEFGSVENYPDSINLADYPENSEQWRRAILTKHDQAHNPNRKIVDADKSPVAGLLVPELREGKFWVAGCLWFPTINLQKTFPALSRICQKFERWLKKYPLVFDNTKADNNTKYNYQICNDFIVRKVYALPEAYSLLENGAFVILNMTSPKNYSEFKRNLELSGHI
jgi:hypothetical protein